MRSPSPDKGRAGRRAWAVPLLALALGLGTMVADPLAVRGLRHASFDQFQRWHPRPMADDDAAQVSIVDIDDESLRRLGQWPWPCARVAQLVDEIARLQPASTALDALFAEPDRTDADGGAGSDARLAAALARGNAAIGFAMAAGPVRPAGAQDTLRLKASVLAVGGDPRPFIPEFDASVDNLPELQDAAPGQGAMTFIPDDDGVVRQVPLLLNLRGRLVPSLAAEALRLAGHAAGYTVRSAGDAGGVVDVRIGARTIPTDASGALWVHYARPRPQRYVPAWQVLARQVPAERLRGRIVLVGTSAQGLLDLRFSPRGGVVPGVEIHAQALEQVLSGRTLDRPGWAPAAEWLAALLGGLAIGTLAMRRGALVSGLGMLAVAALLAGGAWALFLHGRLLVDPLVPLLAIAFVFVPTTLVKHLLTEREQRWIKAAFSRYVSPNLVDYLVAHPETLALGGRRQVCSFVFADLAGFTTLMETMDPTRAVAVLNDYLDRMIAIAFDHGGTLDRIVGDAVAIVFSTPVEQVDHAPRALRCALAMHAFARRYVDELAAQGTPFCETRIGVHTGEVTVGNFGGGAIFDYRALGDPVNVAARLEGANKHLGTLVCVSAATLAGCPGMAAEAVRPIGRLRVAGRAEAVAVCEPLAASAADAAAPAAYRQAFERMRDGDPGALAAFEALAQAAPADPLVRLHLARLREGARDDVVVLAGK